LTSIVPGKPKRLPIWGLSTSYPKAYPKQKYHDFLRFTSLSGQSEGVLFMWRLICLTAFPMLTDCWRHWFRKLKVTDLRSVNHPLKK